MAEQPPASERRGVPRKAVPAAVENILADPNVKWVAILHDDTIGAFDRFLIFAYTAIQRSKQPSGRAG